MFKNFEAKIEKAREVILGPREIYFENGIKLVTRVGSDEPSLKFIKGDDKIFDLTKLAPEGTKIIFDPKNEWEASAKTKEIKIGKFTGVDCILTFLHEVGHINKPEDEDITNSAKSHYNHIVYNKGSNSDFSSDELLKNASKEIIQGERNAWAYSLRQTRTLERELGIDIMGKMGNVKQIKEFVDSFLSVYKNRYPEKISDLDIFSEEEIESFLIDQAEKRAV